MHLLCGDLSFHIVYIVETWLDDSVPDNELAISSYSLGGGGLLHIRDLSHNAMLMDNKELPFTMVVATAFVSVHCTVCLPPLPLFCNV